MPSRFAITKSLRNRFLFAFVGLALGPLLLLAFVIVPYSYRTDLGKAQRFEQEVAHRAAHAIRSFLEKAMVELHTGLLAYELFSMDTTNFKQYLQVMVHGAGPFGERSQLFRWLRVFDRKGHLVASSPFGSRTDSGSESMIEPMLKASDSHRQAAWLIGKVFFDSTTGEPLIEIARRIEDPVTAEIKAFFIAGLRLKKLWDDLGALSSVTSQTVFVTDSLNRVVAHPDPSVVLRQTFFATPSRPGVNTGLSNDRAVIVWKRISIEGLSLTVYAQRDFKEALSSTRDFMARFLGVLLVALIAASVFGVLVIRGVVKPVETIAYAAKKIGAGDLSQRVDFSRQDELGDLAVSFNQMTGSLSERTVALVKSNSQLKRINKELEQFVYVASHHLQEPLRKVGGFLELLAERYHDRLDRDAHDFIEYAVDGARRMKALINDLLAYSRIETRGLPIKQIESAAVLKKVLLELEPAVKAADALVRYDQMPFIAADEAQLEQLFSHLIQNAIKYHRQAPIQVEISAEKIENAWRFCVQDNGMGIDSSYQVRIFKMFQRLHGISEYSGTGIGLALCKKILERHGGTIWVESTPGLGSTFYFTIPDLMEDI